MGTPQVAAISLEKLLSDGHDIKAVYTQPDRPSGRGKRIAFSPVKEAALSHGIKVLQPTKIKTVEALKEFRDLGADVAIVVAYGRILPEVFLNAFPKGAINVHFSLLPKYRGAAPVNWAIVKGETKTGVTTMKMDAGLDTGDILLQRSTEIGQDETAIQLMERLGNIGAELLIETLQTLNSISPRKQNEADVSFAPIMKKQDGLIDWTLSADEICRRIRGFQPFPSSYAFHEGARLTIWKGSAIKSSRSEAEGSILEAAGNNLIVACGAGSELSVEEIQPEGKRRMSIRDFLNGAKIKAGDVLTSEHLESGMAN